MNKAYVSLGANKGNRVEMLALVVERISFANKILRISNVYETYPRDGVDRDPYLNCCLEIETDMGSHALMQFLKETERQLRDMATTAMNYGSIDCDLIACGEEVLLTPELTLPHPDAYRRAFVMIPLSEVNPEWLHPILKKTAQELAKETYWPGWGRFFSQGKSLLDF